MIYKGININATSSNIEEWEVLGGVFFLIGRSVSEGAVLCCSGSKIQSSKTQEIYVYVRKIILEYFNWSVFKGI